VECGKAGSGTGTAHAIELIEACLAIAQLPSHDLAPNDVDLFRTYAIVKVPIHSTFSFDGSAADFCFRPDIRSLLGVLRAFIWPVSQFYNHGYKFAKPPFRAHRAPYPVFYRRPERPGMGS
jgi:hypothetical protein